MLKTCYNPLIFWKKRFTQISGSRGRTPDLTGTGRERRSPVHFRSVACYGPARIGEARDRCRNLKNSLLYHAVISPSPGETPGRYRMKKVRPPETPGRPVCVGWQSPAQRTRVRRSENTVYNVLNQHSCRDFHFLWLSRFRVIRNSSKYLNNRLKLKNSP